ncbi:nucleoside deaminase [Ferribacterium limneticum]|uniref:nucleoside deaminase n=1 Tax=Ferribacterium limneticum TaxID=76259 RepID=UPI001CF938A4|nr:nucleoside deaminase [Ferribacterium limneticum]UCV26978.1 nucleoside deaminase [Ferribacterium limneticum]UCV30895.1 nucleoside deaminase [Ferribacterium limneticum]
MNPDDQFLARAIELARQGSASGEGGPFGAVIVRDGKIIAEGWNRVVASHDPTAHAEIGAIRSACAAQDHFHLHGCTLYASSEPCPMCLSAAYWARIERIIFANSRAEAAAIGFCDDELYCELNRHFSARSIVMEHHPLAGSLEPLERWAANPGRILY